MAENPILGSIAVASNTGPIADPGSVGQADVLGGIAAIGAGITQAAKTGATEGLRTELTQATDAALAASPAADEELLTGVGPNKQDQFLIDKIARLQQGVGSARGSNKAALELEIRRATAALGDRFPGLRDEALQAANNFIRTDPEFAALELADAASTTFQASQAKELQDLKDLAYGSVAGGIGLGMSRTKTEFGSPEFVAQFNYLHNLQTGTNRNNIISEALNAQEALDVRGHSSKFQKQVQGQQSVVSDLIRTTRASVREAANAARDITQPGAKETLNRWVNGGKDEHLSQVANNIMTIESWFADIPIEMADTSEYQAALGLKNEVIGSLNALSKAMITGDFNTVSAWETYETMREVEFQTNNPAIANVGRIMENNRVLFELVGADFAAQGDIFMNNLSGFTRQSLEGILGQMGALTLTHKLPPYASAGQIANHQRAIRTQNPNIYNNGQVDTRGTQTNASTFAQRMFSKPMLKLMGSTGMAPEVSQQAFAAVGSAVEDYILAGEQPIDGNQPMLAQLEDKGILAGAASARNSSQPNSVLLYANNMGTVMHNDLPRRDDNYRKLQTVNIGQGVPANSVIVVDRSALKQGKVTFIVDPTRVETLVSTESQRLITGNLGIGGLQPRVAAQGRAQKTTTELNDTVNRELAQMAHLTALREGSDTPDYERAWLEGGFATFFGVDVPAEPAKPAPRRVQERVSTPIRSEFGVLPPEGQ